MYYHSAIFFTQIFLMTSSIARAASLLLTGGTIVSFNVTSNSLAVTRNGSVLVTNGHIAAIWPAGETRTDVPNDVEVINISGKILTPGFIDTHRHGWQTAFKTLGSNTSLIEYFGRYGEFASVGQFTPEDVYIGQLAGLYEALNAGVTTILDHAHHTWSNETAIAGLNASIDSGARVFWAYAFHNVTNYTVPEQIPNFREIATTAAFKGTRTSLGIAYDNFGPNPNVAEVNTLLSLAK
jgi:cytosine/adenosine deaminase-related metal-dependent hydrolase